MYWTEGRFEDGCHLGNIPEAYRSMKLVLQFEPL